ncbi:hypothetical protein KPL71_008122 [Citrus sinensis]|uniref:Uncharacterized protein n=1 Tax=Citrus sinensis TaxID=2711 RepID=A0ACB8M442_CITSI|nr:hypothetical protein KPL71_008122 [Citrus sinensis]
MVQPVDIIPEVLPSGKTLPIMSFTSQGTPVYPDKIDGHFLWDVPGSGRCDPGCPCNNDEDDYSSRPKKKNIIYPACKLYLPEDDDDEPDYPPPLPLYNKRLQWIQKHQPRSCKPIRSSAGLLPSPSMVPCMMFSSASVSASDYSSEYPPLEKRSDQKHQVWSKPFVNSPISSSGHLEEPKPFEAVLNWQTQNARVQNASLTSLHSKVDQIAHRSSAVETRVTSLSDQLTNLYNSLHAKVAQLDCDLRAMIARGDNSYEFTRKEQEIRQLQAEIARINADNQRRQAVHTAPPSYFPTEPYHPLGSLFPTIPRDYTPERVFPMTYHLNPQPAKPKPRPPRRPVPPPAVSIPPPVQSPSKAEQKKPAENYLITAPELDQLNSSSEESSPSDSVETFDSITETSEPNGFSFDDSQQHLTDIFRLLMVDHAESTTTDPPPREPGQPYVDIPSDVEGENEGDNSNPPPRVRTKVASGNGPWFTFDDLPPARWRECLQELSAWLDLQMVKPDAELSAVLKEFVSRFTGSLRDWFDSLGQYRQLLYLQYPTVSAALMDIHSQFLGEPAAIFATACKEYLQMRCCSMQRSDLHYHFKRMSALFHKIGGINDHTLKHVFLSSLPEELQPEIRRQIANAQQHYHTIYKEILAFKGKTIPNSQLLRLQEWFSRYEFDVEHIKGQKNLIPDFLSRIQTPASPIFYTSPVFLVFMATRSTATSLPSKALTQKDLPKAFNPSKATSLLWTLLEWFSHIPQWRSQLQQLSHNHHLSTIPSHEAEKFTSVFIVHRPYFRHPETTAFFAQPQISHYHTTPHPSTLDQDPMFKKALMNHLLSLNHVPPPPQDIISSSIGPRHEMFMVPNPSGSSKVNSSMSFRLHPNMNKASHQESFHNLSPSSLIRHPNADLSAFPGLSMQKDVLSMMALLIYNSAPCSVNLMGPTVTKAASTTTDLNPAPAPMITG